VSARSRRIAGVTVSALARATWSARFGFASRQARRQAFAEQARIACEALGPAFIKLGQVISVRPDLFPTELVFEMEKLQDSVAPLPVASIRRVIFEEFGRPAEEIFATFEDTPLASASIAQVHRATLREPIRPAFGAELPAGKLVAVKVVRPGAEEAILADIAEARRLVSRIARLKRLRRLNLPGFLDEFAATLVSEVDLRNEGRVSDRFAFDFRDDPLMVVPRVAWRLTTRRVLVNEFVRGWRLSEITEAERAGVDAYALAVHGASVFMRQVLVLGRFHADLHPANLLVTPDSRICYLDFGIVGRTSGAERIAIAQVLAATVYGDADRALKYSEELGLVVPEKERPAVRESVAQLLHDTMGGNGQRADVRRFAVGFLSMLAQHGIHVPIGYGLLIKALVTVEGVARALYPQIDITEAAKPYATELIAERMFKPARLAEKLPDAVRAALRELAS
jgi:ubiquinone biosynthesis protein